MNDELARIVWIIGYTVDSGDLGPLEELTRELEAAGVRNASAIVDEIHKMLVRQDTLRRIQASLDGLPDPWLLEQTDQIMDAILEGFRRALEQLRGKAQRRGAATARWSKDSDRKVVEREIDRARKRYEAGWVRDEILDDICGGPAESNAAKQDRKKWARRLLAAGVLPRARAARTRKSPRARKPV